MIALVQKKLFSRKEKFTAIENCKLHTQKIFFCGGWVGLFAEFQTDRCLFKETESISIELKFKRLVFYLM